MSKLRSILENYFNINEFKDFEFSDFELDEEIHHFSILAQKYFKNNPNQQKAFIEILTKIKSENLKVSDVVLGLLFIDGWMTRNNKSISFTAQMEYINCCIEGRGLMPFSNSLKDVIIFMVETYGIDG